MDKKKRGIELVKGYLTEQRKPKPDRAYLKSERVQEGLAKLPGWRLSRDGAALQQSRSFDDDKAALAYVWLVCRMAASHGQPIEVGLNAEKVVVQLKGHPVRGCTGGLGKPVLKLAEMIG